MSNGDSNITINKNNNNKTQFIKTKNKTNRHE